MYPGASVQAEIVADIAAKTINAQSAAAVAELEKKLPARYTIEANGTVEESAKGLRSIASAK